MENVFLRRPIVCRWLQPRQSGLLFAPQRELLAFKDVSKCITDHKRVVRLYPGTHQLGPPSEKLMSSNVTMRQESYNELIV